MTDIFGIYNGLKATQTLYFTLSRRSGRTTSMLESLKNGDRVIFLNSKQARLFEILAKERNLEIECRVLTINENPFDKFPPSKGRTIFDHSWVEEFYYKSLDKAAESIGVIQRELSGYGTPHIETRRQAEEIYRFR